MNKTEPFKVPRDYIRNRKNTKQINLANISDKIDALPVNVPFFESLMGKTIVS